MNRPCRLLMVLLLFGPTLWAQDKDSLDKIRDEFAKAGQADDNIDASETASFTGRALAIAEREGPNRTGFEALRWVFYICQVSKAGGHEDCQKPRAQAFEMLVANFPDSSRLPEIVADALATPNYRRPADTEELSGYLAKLATVVKSDVNKATCMLSNAELWARHNDDVAPISADQLEKTIAAFKDVAAKYGKLTHPTDQGKRTFEARVSDALFPLENLRIGVVAPEIEGKDLDNVAFKLSDYRGKVVVVDFWGDW